MSRNSDPKCRNCRREGEKLFLKGDKCYTSKCPVVRRNFPPGQQGQKGKPRLSNYGQQLREKQKAKRQYGLNETQFFNYFTRAENQPGDTSENLGRQLELRLDNVVYRLGLADSRGQARQLVGHSHLTVNGRSVNIPSYRVKAGDTVAVKKTHLDDPYFQERLKKIEKQETPSWLSLDKKALTGQVASLPTVAELQQNFQTQLIIEFYSR